MFDAVVLCEASDTVLQGCFKMSQALRKCTSIFSHILAPRTDTPVPLFTYFVLKLGQTSEEAHFRHLASF